MPLPRGSSITYSETRRTNERRKFQHEHPQVPEDDRRRVAARDRAGGVEVTGLRKIEGQREIAGNHEAHHSRDRAERRLRRGHYAGMRKSVNVVNIVNVVIRESRDAE